MTTSGLSVDPDDLTKEGVEATGARVISYGAPVFPGAMFLVARLKGRYILGAPACVYFNTHTMLDILLPRIMAGERVTAAARAQAGLGRALPALRRVPLPELLFRERRIAMSRAYHRDPGRGRDGLGHRPPPFLVSALPASSCRRSRRRSRCGGMSPFRRRYMRAPTEVEGVRAELARARPGLRPIWDRRRDSRTGGRGGGLSEDHRAGRAHRRDHDEEAAKGRSRGVRRRPGWSSASVRGSGPPTRWTRSSRATGGITWEG